MAADVISDAAAATEQWDGGDGGDDAGGRAGDLDGRGQRENLDWMDSAVGGLDPILSKSEGNNGERGGVTKGSLSGDLRVTSTPHGAATTRQPAQLRPAQPPPDPQSPQQHRSDHPAQRPQPRRQSQSPLLAPAALERSLPLRRRLHLDAASDEPVDGTAASPSSTRQRSSMSTLALMPRPPADRDCLWAEFLRSRVSVNAAEPAADSGRGGPSRGGRGGSTATSQASSPPANADVNASSAVTSANSGSLWAEFLRSRVGVVAAEPTTDSGHGGRSRGRGGGEGVFCHLCGRYVADTDFFASQLLFRPCSTPRRKRVATAKRTCEVQPPPPPPSILTRCHTTARYMGCASIVSHVKHCASAWPAQRAAAAAEAEVCFGT